MYIQGQARMGNVRKWLARCEEIYPASQLLAEMATRASDNNCEMATTKICGEYYGIVVDQHGKCRADTRVILNDTLLESVMDIVNRPDMSSWLTENPMYWDDESDSLVPTFDTDPYGWKDNGQRIVVDERTDCIYLFEAGERYIHLVTVFGTRMPNNYNPEIYPYLRFIAEKGARVRKVRRSGFVTSNLKEIPEVNLVPHKKTKRNRK